MILKCVIPSVSATVFKENPDFVPGSTSSTSHHELAAIWISIWSIKNDKAVDGK